MPAAVIARRTDCSRQPSSAAMSAVDATRRHSAVEAAPDQRRPELRLGFYYEARILEGDVYRVRVIRARCGACKSILRCRFVTTSAGQGRLHGRRLACSLAEPRLGAVVELQADADGGSLVEPNQVTPGDDLE